MTIWKNPTDNSLHDDMNGEALTLESWPKGMTQLTDAEVSAIQAAAQVLTPAQLLAQFQQAAQTALSATDTTFARIQEAITLGLTKAADPSVIEWIEYRKALRAEVRATVVGALATKPTTYPAGT